MAARCAVVLVGVVLSSQAQSGPAFFVRSLVNPSERSESRPDLLDTPVLPGSVMKTLTLIAALESQVIEPDTTRMCRRSVTLDGRRYTCSHPDLKRGLTPAEALAHSCNDFFVSLAPRLPRQAVNDVRARVGLPPLGPGVNYPAALVGLDGPPVSPRVLLDVVTRLAGADRDRPMRMSDAVRRVLLQGLSGAARYGTASVLSERRLSALAKTGTAPMPGGSYLGLAIVLEPADRPTRGVVVVAPGVAGLDAATIAADLLSTSSGGSLDPPMPSSAAKGAGAGGSNQPPLKLRRSAEALAKAEDPPLLVSVGLTNADGSSRVVQVNLEDYVARVVAGEGQPAAAAAAQEALAITVRTFALANRNRHRREGFDFCDTTHCQVIRSATETSRRGAAATAGRVLTRDGIPATVFYSALCGGRPELASEVWPGATDYLPAPQDDDACKDEPGWESEIRVEQIERALRDAGQRGDRLRELRILQRDASGRVARLRAEGFTPGELSGHDFRMAVGRVAGWQRMKSTAFEISRTSSGYAFRGRGFGHGVGLCVIGAGHRADAGRSAEEILKFYFPALAIESYRGSAMTTVPRTATTARPSPIDSREDVLVALPGQEETERARLVQLIRSARDDMAAASGAKPPTAIRVTVHPTVEAFGRATGQPWWVSAATDGAEIDLLPLSILRQQGQLERTVRHEVAHVLIDSALKRRPLWVREGAAFYFADPDAAQTPRARTACPRDEEFLRPISAGAHRAAYARAEACFRRAIANGTAWRSVR